MFDSFVTPARDYAPGIGGAVADRTVNRKVVRMFDGISSLRQRALFALGVRFDRHEWTDRRTRWLSIIFLLNFLHGRFVYRSSEIGRAHV